MSDLGDLKGRVDSAVDRMSTTLEARHGKVQTLVRMLSTIEARFNAQTEELARCHSRIEALSAANDQLVSLVERLIGVIERSAESEVDGPIGQAAAMAAGFLVGGPDDAGAAPAQTPAPAAAPPPDPVAAPPQAPDPAAVGPAKASPPSMGGMRFEDVSDAELAAEFDGETAEGTGPPPPAGASPEAQPAASGGHHVEPPAPGPHLASEVGERLATVLNADPVPASAAPAPSTESDPELEFVEIDDALGGGPAGTIDIPEPQPGPEAAVAAEFDDSDADIKAMMARLELAASRAQARIDDEARRTGAAGGHDAPPTDRSGRVA